MLGTRRLGQRHIPNFCSTCLAFRSLDVQRHDERARFFVTMGGMTLGGELAVAEIPSPGSDVAVRTITECHNAIRLADDLKVTRGSFYWHFKNREDLLHSLVSYWKDKNTAAIIESIAQATSLADGILRLFETCVDAARFDPRLDLALREWARRSHSIHELVDSEDAARIDALRLFFQRFDYPMPQALIRARVFYYSQIGFYALGTSDSLKTRLSYTEAYFEAFTGRELAPLEAKHFRKHIFDKYGEQT